MKPFEPVRAYPECPLFSPQPFLLRPGWTVDLLHPFGVFPKCPCGALSRTLKDAPSCPGSSLLHRLKQKAEICFRILWGRIQRWFMSRKFNFSWFSRHVIQFSENKKKTNTCPLPLKVLVGSEANRTARLSPIPEEQPVISTTFFSIEIPSKMFLYSERWSGRKPGHLKVIQKTRRDACEKASPVIIIPPILNICPLSATWRPSGFFSHVCFSGLFCISSRHFGNISIPARSLITFLAAEITGSVDVHHADCNFSCFS